VQGGDTCALSTSASDRTNERVGNPLIDTTGDNFPSDTDTLFVPLLHTCG